MGKIQIQKFFPTSLFLLAILLMFSIFVIHVIQVQASLISDQYYWFGDEGNVGIELIGKFQSLERMAETFDLLQDIGIFKSPTEPEDTKTWKLHDILVYVDFNANGNVATWKVSGPKPLLMKYLEQMKRGYKTKWLFYDFGYTFVDFEPMHFGEDEP